MNDTITTKKFQNLLDIESLSINEIEELFALTDQIKAMPKAKARELLPDKVITLLFLESSTRTRCGFELAGKKLGAHVLNINPTLSAIKKSETLYDTLLSLSALGSDAFIIRHPENGTVAKLAEQLPDLPIINAGDGSHAHPSQALLDLYTIKKLRPNLPNPSIAMIGDAKYSRVVRSQITAFHKANFNDIRLIAPKFLIPDDLLALNVKSFQSFEEGLDGVDIIITLRVQKERMDQGIQQQAENFLQNYGLTKARLALAKKNAIVMHPGPINRDVEIQSQVADGPHSVILKQIENGLYLRMAILLKILGHQ